MKDLHAMLGGLLTGGLMCLLFSPATAILVGITAVVLWVVFLIGKSIYLLNTQ